MQPALLRERIGVVALLLDLPAILPAVVERVGEIVVALVDQPVHQIVQLSFLLDSERVVDVKRAFPFTSLA